MPTHLKTDKVSLWLYRSLESHTLSQKLSWLLSDKEHLLTCYGKNAFMCQEKYTEATLICLRAVERSEPSLMSDIDPCLFLNKFGAKDFHKVHRRCSSFPDSSQFRNAPVKKLSFKESVETFEVDSTKEVCKKITEKETVVRNIYGKLKPWRSMPNLQLEGMKIRQRSSTMIKQSSTTPSSPMRSELSDKLSPSMLKIDYLTQEKKFRSMNNRKHMIRSRSIIKDTISENRTKLTKIPQSQSGSVHNLNMKSQEEENMSTKSLPCTYNRAGGLNLAINLVRSAPDYRFSVLPGEKDYTKRPKKSFIEDGGSSVLPMSTGYFPRPVKGQTLTSFLSSAQFSRTNAELDRENAHFSISEAMISVIEQIKWKRGLKLDEEQVEESDEEINNLKQRIRLRRRQKQIEKQRKLWSTSLLSDGRTDSKYIFLFLIFRCPISKLSVKVKT